MARTYGFSSATKVIAAAAETIVFPPSEIDSAGIVAFHICFSDTAGNATNTVADITRVRIKANGTTIYDVSQSMLLAFQERFFKNPDVTTLQGLTIPFYMGDAPNDDAADACQFMPGASCTVEIDKGAAVDAADTLMLAWTKTTVPAQYYPTLISQPDNVAASAINQRVGLGAPGFIQGVGLTSGATVLRQARIVLSGIEVGNIPGPNYNGLLYGQGISGLVQNLQSGQTTTASVFLKMNQGLPANPANSWLELTKGAGGAVTNEYCLYSLVPCGQQGG